jgi:hypothetical protein
MVSIHVIAAKRMMLFVFLVKARSNAQMILPSEPLNSPNLVLLKLIKIIQIYENE